MRNTVESFTEIQINYISSWVCIYGYPDRIEAIVGELTDSLRKPNWEAAIDFSMKSEIFYGLYVQKLVSRC